MEGLGDVGGGEIKDDLLAGSTRVASVARLVRRGGLALEGEGCKVGNEGVVVGGEVDLLVDLLEDELGQSRSVGAERDEDAVRRGRLEVSVGLELRSTRVFSSRASLLDSPSQRTSDTSLAAIALTSPFKRKRGRATVKSPVTPLPALPLSTPSYAWARGISRTVERCCAVASLKRSRAQVSGVAASREGRGGREEAMLLKVRRKGAKLKLDEVVRTSVLVKNATMDSSTTRAAGVREEQNARPRVNARKVQVRCMRELASRELLNDMSVDTGLTRQWKSCYSVHNQLQASWQERRRSASSCLPRSLST